MRTRVLAPVLAFLAIAACAKSDAPPADSAATAAAPAPAPAAPAAMTATDVRGNWTGKTIAADKDSVLREWTSTYDTDSTGKLTIAGATTPITYTVKFDADSMIMRSSPYAMPGNAKGPKITFHAVGRMRDGKLVGTVNHLLADKPDSVVARARFESTRAQ